MPYDVLPARLRDIIPSREGQETFRNVVNAQLAAGKSESVAMASAWAALQRAGYDKDEDGQWVKKVQPTPTQVHVPGTKPDDDDDDEDDRASSTVPAKLGKARGAEPIYMYRPVLNAEQIIAWAATQGFSTTLPPDDLHVTVVFSKTPFSAEFSRIADQHGIVHHGNIVVRGGKRTVTPLGDKGAVVLKIESAELQNEYAFFRSVGASWDYQEYTPHISITYRGAGIDAAGMTPYPGDIVLGALYAKPLNTSWDSEIIEIAVNKRTLDDDTFTTPEEAYARSLDLGLGGAIHGHQTADGMAVYMPGEDHEEYLEAMAERTGIVGDDEDESPDAASTDKDLLTRAVTAIMRAIMEQSVEKRIPILKADDEQRIVWGWASVATVKGMSVLDHQGDMMTPDEMVKMANRFMESARAAKAMHAGDQIGEVIHSLPLTAELAKALGIEADREGWIIGMKIKDDAMWRSVKSGTFGAFSIGGRAKREALV